MKVDMDVTIKSNIDAFKQDLDRKVQNALNAIGLEAERYAKEHCPVDTGRLRNSITYATQNYHSSGDGEPATADDMRLYGIPDKHEVVVGTNVEYAPDVEYRDIAHRTGKAHFLRDSMDKQKNTFKQIIDAAMKS